MDPLELVTRLPLPWLSRCRVPRHLGEVTSTGPEVPARECGLAQSDIERVWEAVEAGYESGISAEARAKIFGANAVDSWREECARVWAGLDVASNDPRIQWRE